MTQEKLQRKIEKLNNKIKKINIHQKELSSKIEDLNSRLEKEKELMEYLKENDQKKYQKKIKRAETHQKNSPPQRGVIEEIGNSVTHGVGFGLAIAAFILMLTKASGFRAIFSSYIYGISMMFMMLMSCLYHALPAKSMGKHIFRRFDYTSIYVLIGGTFTPIFLLFFWYHFTVISIILCALQWAIIISGIVNVCIFGPGRHKAINFTLYIVLGWCGLIFIPYLIKYNLELFIFILAGGIVYTLGIIPFVMKKKVAHFIWHFFVLGGAILQFIGIYLTLFC